MKKIISIVFLLSFFWISILSQPIYDSAKIKLEYTYADYPRFDCSTSAWPLVNLVTCKILDLKYEWKSFGMQTEKYLVPITTPEQMSLYNELISVNGTDKAYINLIDTIADIIIVARPPSEDEINYAKKKGVTLKLQEIALDAFVFIVNKNNPVTALTTEQIRNIYTSKITNWEQVGGWYEQIHPYTRERNSGSQELMNALVMNELKSTISNDMELMGMMGPINRIGKDTLGLGYSVYYYEHFMAPNEKLKLCAVDGVVPDYETIATKKYPYTTPVFAVIRENTGRESNTNKMFEWLITEQGQNIVKESGYVHIK